MSIFSSITFWLVLIAIILIIIGIFLYTRNGSTAGTWWTIGIGIGILFIAILIFFIERSIADVSSDSNTNYITTSPYF